MISIRIITIRTLHSGCRSNGRKESGYRFFLVLRLRHILRLCILIPEQITHNGHRIHGRILHNLLSREINAGDLRRQILQVSWIGHRNHSLRSCDAILFCFHRIEQAVHGDRLGYILAGFVTGKRDRDPDVLAGNKLREEVRKMTVLPDNAVQNDGIVFRFDRLCLLRRGSGRRDDDIKGLRAFFRKHRAAECIRLRGRARRIHFLYGLFPAGHALKRKLQLRLEALRSRFGGNRPVIILVHDIQNQGFCVAHGNRGSIQISRAVQLSQRAAVIANNGALSIRLIISSVVRLCAADLLRVICRNGMIGIGVKYAEHRSARRIIFDVKMMSAKRLIDGALREDKRLGSVLYCGIFRCKIIKFPACLICIGCLVVVRTLIGYRRSAASPLPFGCCFLQKADPLPVGPCCCQMILRRNENFLRGFVHFHAF